MSLYDGSKTGKFYYKLLFSMLILAVVPILLFSSIAYYNVSQTFNDETAASSTKFLNQTINAMEIIVKQIKESCRQMTLAPSFQNFETFPNGAYYEKLSGTISAESLGPNYWYLMHKKNAVESINRFKLSNPYVDSVYYYDGQKNIVMTSGLESRYVQYAYDEFPDKAWFEVVDSASNKEVYLMETREVGLNGQPAKKIISLIMWSNVKDNAFIINLNADLLYQEVIQKLASPSNLLVVSQSGALIFGGHRTISDFETKIMDNLFAQQLQTAGWFNEKNEKDDFLVTYSASNLLNWVFINFNDLKSLNKGLDYLNRIIILSLLLLGFTLMAAAYVSTRKLYKPVNAIMSFLGDKKQDKRKSRSPAGPRRDEFRYIREMMKGAIDEKEYFKKRFEESLPYYRERFLNALIRGLTTDVEEIRQKSEFLKVEFELSDMALLLISIDEQRLGHKLNLIDRQMYKLKLMDLIARHWDDKKLLCIEAGDHKIAVVMNTKEAEMKEIPVAAHNLLEQLSGEISIGLGNFCRDASQLPRAYKEAEEALQYQILFGSGQVIDINEVTLNKVDGYMLPKAQLEKMSGLIRMGNVAEAKQTLHDIFREIRNSKKTIHYKRVRPLFIQILTCITNTLTSVGTEIENITPSDVFEQLLNKNNTEESLKWLEELIEDVSAHILAEMRGKSGKHIERVIQIIDENFEQDLSLQSVALELQLNPSYVSRLFKNFTGITFIEYLTQKKIEKSKALLIESDCKVKEIAERVGYNNTHYFNKIFKENVGLTPGEYRKSFERHTTF